MDSCTLKDRSDVFAGDWGTYHLSRNRNVLEKKIKSIPLPFNFTFEHDNKGLSWYEVDYKKRLEAEEIEKE